MQSRPPPGQKAETYALFAFISQAIGGFLFAVVVLFLSNNLIVALYVLLVAIILAMEAYVFVYRPIRAGDYELAKGPAAMLGLLSIFLGGIFPFIFYSMTSAQLQGPVYHPRAAPAGFDSTPGGVSSAPPMQSQTPSSPPSPPAFASPVVPAPMAAPASTAPPPPGMAPGPYCPQCGQPGTWIPQYSRYYCYPDGRYL